MKKEMIEMFCPQCGMMELEQDSFDHLIVMERGRALFTYSCPNCDGKLSSLQDIPDEFEGYVDARLSELARRYPNSNFERFCSDESLRNEEEYLEQFRAELAQTFGVDDALSLGQDNPNSDN